METTLSWWPVGQAGERGPGALHPDPSGRKSAERQEAGRRGGGGVGESAGPEGSLGHAAGLPVDAAEAWGGASALRRPV